MPAEANLLFAQGSPAGTDLVFGDTGVGASGPRVDASLAATLPGLAAAVVVVPSVSGALVATLPSLHAAAEVGYRTQTQRPTVGKTEAAHQLALKLQAGPEQPHQDTRSAPVGWSAFWERVTNGSQTVEHRLPDVLRPARVPQTGVFQNATKRHTETGYRHQGGTAIWQDSNAVFQNATPARHATGFRHQGGTRTHGRREAAHQNATLANMAAHYGSFQTAQALVRLLRAAAQEGVPPPPGISVTGAPLLPQPQPCYFPNSSLLFEFPLGTPDGLVFICDGYSPAPPPSETVVIPVQRVYIVLNNLALRRTSDNAVVPAFRFSLSLDVSSWSWGFSASLPATAQALVEPVTGPVELSAWVNGQEFRVLAEQVARERSFGQATISVSGRGRNAFLDAPYAPVQTFSNSIERTHQQLFDDVLTFNGVPMGWAIDYGLEAWNVPAGVWNHQGTYVGALNTLAQAAGGYMIPHPSAQSFKVRHLYPAKPWEWGAVTPDFVLPSGVVTREGLTWTEKPAYNRVYVSGAEQGVLGRVTRAGTAGDLLAPMVTDPLITAAAAARQRGLAVLGDTGRQIEHQLRLPVLQATGIIQPGAFVEYTDNGASRMGLVRSTQVDVSVQDDTPVVWQTMGVECHV